MKIGIITGASSGLGREFSLRAFDRFEIDELWLVARREEPLRKIEQALAGHRVRVLSMDLSKTESFETLRGMFDAEKPDIRLLINNAGLGKLGEYEKIDPSAIEAMCNVNVRALSLMTAAAIPHMSRGASIIMISSIASFAATPVMTVYSATKAYVSALANGIRYELRDRGINVLTVNPCPMETEFLALADIPNHSDKFASLPRCKPEKVAAKALDRASRGKGNYTPLFLFKFYRVLCKLVPHRLIMGISGV